ncbi:hypothetical protein IFM89_018372 [Coptis chinensis]|uniref:FAF domain-containing protein n=1 Tax=Coptis chinensis TaxID=261450 RepID=A0A835HMW8_9MAGN|nr:hypothetical protein IFM89_018372 [Coptis chinensis]
MDILSIATTLFGNKSSSTSSSFSSSTNDTTQKTENEPGLKSLAASPHRNRSCISRTNLLCSSHSSSEPSFSVMDTSNEKKKMKREFPPPIPLLARTENMLCHMPWVLKRSYKDGRLVMHEVPVKHHEFFKVHRSNGRLVLRMMYMADDQLAPKKNDIDQVLANDCDNDDKDINILSSSISTLSDGEAPEKNVKSDEADDVVVVDDDDDNEKSTCHEENVLNLDAMLLEEEMNVASIKEE